MRRSSVHLVQRNRKDTGNGERVRRKEVRGPLVMQILAQLCSWPPRWPADAGGAVPLSHSEPSLAQVFLLASYGGAILSEAAYRELLAFWTLVLHPAEGWFIGERILRRPLEVPVRQWQLPPLIFSPSSLWEPVCGEQPRDQWKKPLRSVWEGEGRQAGLAGRGSLPKPAASARSCAVSLLLSALQLALGFRGPSVPGLLRLADGR